VTAPSHPGEQGRAGDEDDEDRTLALALAHPGRIWLGLVLLIPGGLILAAGLGIAWAGLVLLIPGLRRLSTAWLSTQDVDAAAVAPPRAGQSSPVGTPVTGSAPQPYGEPHEPSSRGLDYALESPDHVPPELRAFAARGFARLNRWRES